MRGTWHRESETYRSRCLRFIEVVIRETPSYGTRCMRRTSNLRAIVAIRGNGSGSSRHGRAGAGIDGSFQVNQIYRISSHSTTCEHETRSLVVRLSRGCVCAWRGVSRVRVCAVLTVPSMRRKGRPTVCVSQRKCDTTRLDTAGGGCGDARLLRGMLAIWENAHRVPVLRRLLDEVVDGVADLIVGAGVRVGEICKNGDKPTAS